MQDVHGAARVTVGDDPVVVDPRAEVVDVGGHVPIIPDAGHARTLAEINELNSTIRMANEDDPTDVSDIRAATLRLARRIRQQRSVSTMTDGQFAVLVALRAHGPHTLSGSLNATASPPRR